MVDLPIIHSSSTSLGIDDLVRSELVSAALATDYHDSATDPDDSATDSSKSVTTQISAGDAKFRHFFDGPHNEDEDDFEDLLNEARRFRFSLNLNLGDFARMRAEGRSDKHHSQVVV